MHITPVSFTSANANKNKQIKKDDIDLRSELEKEGITLPTFTPAQTGLINGAGWFTVGFLLALLFGRVYKSMKTPLKLSLGINAGIGLVAGGMAYINEKRKAMDVNKK